MTSAALLDQAVAQYRAGRLDAGLQLAAQALQQGGGQNAAQLALLCLAEANQLGPVDTLLEIARQHGLPPLDLCRYACTNLMKIGKRGALVTLATGLPQGHPLRIQAIYHAACARLLGGEVEAALQEFESFRLQVKDYMGLVPYLASDIYNVPFRQGVTVLAASGVDRRLAAAEASPPASTDFRLDRPIETAAPICFAVTADGRYVERFAPGLVAAFDQPGRALHIHVVNGDERTDALLDRLASGLEHLALGISRSEDRRYRTATSYACTRFFVLPALLRAYGRPIVALDIDLLPREALFRLEEACAEDSFDFACYAMDRHEPASIYQASVMVFAPNTRVLDFLDRLGQFCLPKLHQPVRVNWLLDQAALISVLNWQQQRGIAFRFRTLNEVLGGVLADVIAPVASEEEKGSIKASSSGLDGLVDAEGIVTYDWQPD